MENTTALRDRRTQLQLTQEQLGKALGVSQQTVARWENHGSIPTKYLRDLSLVLSCLVEDLIPGRSAAGKSRFSDTTVQGGEENVPFGTLELVFCPAPPRGPSNRLSPALEEQEPTVRDLIKEYPISENECSRLRRRLCQLNGENTWFSFDTLDNRVVFVNRTALEGLELLGDDVIPMPSFEHLEVYRALSDHDFLDFLEANNPESRLARDMQGRYSERFVAGCRDLVRTWGGMEAARRRASGITLETLDGRILHAESDPDKAAYERIEMLSLEMESPAGSHDLPMNDWLVELGMEGYYRSSYWRLGSLRLIEVPYLPFMEAITGLTEDT